MNVERALRELANAAQLMLAEIDTCGHPIDPAYRLTLYDAHAAARAALVAAEKCGWQPIETAPRGKWLQLWWRPKTENHYAETVVIGQVSDSTQTWWNGQRGEHQDIWHITHWRPLPAPPSEG